MNDVETYYKGFGFEEGFGISYEDSDNKIGETFKKDGKILKKDDKDENINLDSFKEMIKDEVFKKFNKPFKNIVVLAGAGASIVNKSKGKTVSDLYEIVDEELAKNEKIYSFQELEKNGLISEDHNLENILSSLIKANNVFENLNINKDKPFIDKNKLKNTERIIKRYIYENTSNYHFDSSCKHNILIKRLSDKLPNSSRLNIITTNYDCLFEEAATYLKFWVFDGFSFSNPPTFDSDIFDWQLVKPIPNNKTQELKYRSNIINLLKVHGSIDWKMNNNNIIKITDNKKINVDDIDDIDDIRMIFPSSEKYMESYQEPYFPLMTKFQELLRKPNTLFITTGFSFGDQHIFEMISQSIQHNNSLSVLITDHSLDNNKNDNWKSLENLSKTYDINFLKGDLNDDLTDYFPII